MQTSLHYLVIQSLESVIDLSPLTVTPETPILDAIALMAAQSKGVLVKSASQVVGCLTQQDIVKLVASGADLNTAQVAQVMQNSVIKLKMQTINGLDSVISLLCQPQLQLVPVVDENDEIVGTITPESICLALSVVAEISDFADYCQMLENQLLQLIMDTIPHSIFWKDINSIFWGCNRNFAKMVGFDNPEDIIGKTDYDLIPNYEEAHFYCVSDAEIMKTNQPQHQTITLTQQADGSPIWLETNKVPLYNTKAEVVGMFGILENITEGKQAQAALETSKERFRFLAESIPQQVWIARPDGSLEYINQQALEYFACTSEQVLDWKWQKLVHPDDLSTSIAAWSKSLATGDNYEVEFRLLQQSSGTYRWHLGRALSLCDQEGKIVGWFGTNTDIDDRVSAEIALRESERKYHTMAQVSPVGLFYTDAQGNCLYVNDRWCQIAGLTPEAALGVGWLSAIHPQDRERIAVEWNAVAQHNQSFRSEYRFLRANGEISWVVGQAISEQSKTGEVITCFGTVTDISDLKRVEAALAERVRLADFLAHVYAVLTQAETLFSIMRNCTEAFVKHIDAAFARIWMLNTEENVLELQVSSGMYNHIDGLHRRIPVGQWKIGLIAQEGKPLISNTVQEDLLISDKEWAKREGIVAFAGYPLIVEGETLGVIAMFSRQQFTESTFTAMGIAADEIALGIKRKQTQAALRKSEERFRNLVETSSDWVWEVDENCVYTYVSPKVRDILGYETQEILGKTPFELMPPAEAERVMQILAPIAAERQSFKCLENTNCHQDGHLVVLETNGVPIFDVEGRFRGFRGIDRDITDRKRTQEELHKSEERFRLLVEGVKDYAIYMLDPEGRVMSWNSGAECITGYQVAEIIGQDFSCFFPPEDIVNALPKQQLDIAAGNGRCECESVFVRKDGSYFWANCILTALRDQSGKLRGFSKVTRDITERKLAEKSLLRLLKAIESTSDAVSIADISGQLSYVNPAFIDIFDYTESQLNADEGLSTNFKTKEVFRRVFETVHRGESWRGEVIMQSRSGESLHIDLRTDAIKDDTGEIVSVVSIYTDITQRKLIEEGLRLRDRAIAASSNGIVIADVSSPDSSIIYVNPAFEHLTGYSADEVMGQNFLLLQGADINQPGLQELSNAMQSGQDCTVILRDSRPDGSLFWHELNISPVYDIDGYLSHYIGIQTDITERQQAETALLVSQERLQYLLTSSPAVIYTCKVSEDFGAIFISENIKDMVGYEAQEFIQSSDFWFSHLHPEDAPKVIAERSRASEKADYSLEYRFLHQDGIYRWVYDQGKVVWDEAGNPLELVGYWADISNRKQLEQELRIALETEKELNELKSRFISMTSHEFRTPLSTILSSSELLEHYSHKWTHEKQLTHLHRIQAAVTRMTEMLNDILVIGKGEAGKLEYRPLLFDLVKYCRHLVEEVRLNLKSQHLVYFSSQYQSICCYMDEKLLGYILSNLLSNALKYSPDGSSVNFTLSCQGGQAVFEIKDQGIGIPEEDLPRLFESFHRARNVGNILGTGLGLAIVKKCVDIHQGTINVNTLLGVGSNFTVTLPLKKYHMR
ncbi:PAS domain S-box protein [Trichormus sp. NMC-1]|uniref:PAS domain S-box protein n=1 Tax=Trichormus sp. NMC-1 TaxID=1853259 RepID=UPI0008DC0D95|nr:PAS domain S-box protein [Trichormus sp. NMC-1]